MFKWLNKFRAVLILILCLGLGFLVGLSIGRYHLGPADQAVSVREINLVNNDEVVDMAPFWKVWSLLNEKYVSTSNGTTTVSDQDRIWGAIEGMTDALGDPYTVFMPPADAEDFKTNISGNFEGVGMEIGIKDESLTVVSPLKGAPAELAGLKAGDKVIAIDAEPAAKLSVDKAVKLIRGPKGTTVKITVLRENVAKPLEFSVIRDVINIPSVKTEIKGDVYVLTLYNFYAESRSQFKKALKEFIVSKKSKLIIDLRGNPGGYLDSAVDMASWFLPLGKVIVRENFGANSNKEEYVYRSKGYDVFTDKLELIILVDGGSASASEILAGALQENGKAKLVGTKTFGKGSVQELVEITKDTSLKVTIAQWLTPNGKSISKYGLTPDVIVEITDEQIKAKIDPQMDMALEILAQ